MKSLRVSYFFNLCACAWVIILCIASHTSADTQTSPPRESAILVLDASGSMWGQLEGRTKIEIAREAVNSMLGTWPTGTDLGLMAYGHREKGSCDDIELILPPSPLDPAAFQGRVNTLNPKGMTPLTAAVKRAAEILRFTEQKATVILLSDGVETCNLDPCAVGASLEEQGIDFTAHVIGFDVSAVEDQRGLRCLAESTGGLFITARDAGELKSALAKTAAPPPAPTPTPVPTATPLPPATLVSADEGVIGTELALSFDAPPNLDGYVYLYVPGKTQSLNYTSVRTGPNGYEPTSIRLPAAEGTYELVWKAGNDQVLSKKTIEVKKAEISLKAPETAPAGTEILVSISAPPGMSGYLYLYAEGRVKSLTYSAVREAATGGYEPAPLQLPTEPGIYLVRFESSSNEVYASTKINVQKPQISLRAPDQAAAGTHVTVELEGPPGLGGYVYLYTEGREQSLHYTAVRENKQRGGYEPMRLRLPAIAGRYQIKLQPSGNDVLAERTIEATALQATLSHTPTRPIATKVEVSISAPEGIDGYLYLFAEGRERSITYSAVRPAKVSGYSPVSLRLPATPGRYEIQWKTGGDEVVAKSTLTIEAAPISLKLASPLSPGDTAQLSIEAPEGIGGYVHILPVGGQKSLSYHGVREGKVSGYMPVKIDVPSAPGSYVARWITTSDEILAETAFEVQARD
jgi:Ca-activated chloride channel family protein